MKRSQAQTPASTSVDLLALAEYVEQFSSKTVVLLGDFVADEFQYGEISRVSREAPVLILRHRETHLVPGGGANAANNLASLGARVLPVTAVGQDPPAMRSSPISGARRVDVTGILRVKGWTTPTKTRFLAGWAHTIAQQVLRVDTSRSRRCPKPRAQNRANSCCKAAPAHALAVSDYGFGVATPQLVRQAGKAQSAIHVTLDARYQLHAYAKSGITSATPNEAELEAQHHTTIGQTSKNSRRWAAQHFPR